MAVVTSRFGKDFIAKASVFTIVAIAVLVKYVRYLIELAAPAQWYPLSIIGGFFLLFIYLFFRLYKYALIKMTVARDGIIWKSLITNKVTVIPYKDIAHVTCSTTNTSGRQYSSYRTTQIELISGKQLSFTNVQFDNYTELIDEIREQRRLLPAPDVTGNNHE